MHGDDLGLKKSDGDLCIHACADDDSALTDHVWSDDGWLAGGPFLVARRIAMRIETWDRVRLSEQERIFGRSKGEGAPFSGGDEFSDPVFSGSEIAAEVARDAMNEYIRHTGSGIWAVPPGAKTGSFVGAGLFE